MRTDSWSGGRERVERARVHGGNTQLPGHSSLDKCQGLGRGQGLLSPSVQPDSATVTATEGQTPELGRGGHAAGRGQGAVRT